MSDYKFFQKNTPRSLSANTVRVGEFLARLSDKHGGVFEVNQSALAKMLNVSRTTVYSAVSSLISHGVIVRLGHSWNNKQVFEWVYGKDVSKGVVFEGAVRDLRSVGEKDCGGSVVVDGLTSDKGGFFPSSSKPLRLKEVGGEQDVEHVVGVGPWVGGRQNWPVGDHYDPVLLENGDRRNVLDKYRYWKMEAIIKDLDDNHRTSLHIAIENLEHDFNIGSIVRTANAFAVEMIHIVGRKRWNRRGAMVTDRYQHIMHHGCIEDFVQWCRGNGMPIYGIDILDTSVPIERAVLPEKCVLLFGQEGTGISKSLLGECEEVLHITQRGSTRSMNVGHAAAVAMYAWNIQNMDDF